jgi:hypothetical protein
MNTELRNLIISDQKEEISKSSKEKVGQAILESPSLRCVKI